MGCIHSPMAVAPAHESPKIDIEQPVPIAHVQIVLKTLPPSGPHAQPQIPQEEAPIILKDSPAKSSTKVSKHLDQPIYTETVDGKLLAAERAITNNDPKTAIEYFEQIITQINDAKDLTIQAMEIRAYSMAQLGTLYVQLNKLPQTYFWSNEALKFYERFQSDYFQEIITLLNNMALWKENEKKYDEAIKNYLRIIDIENGYMAKNDERTLLTKNNLACLYFQSGQHTKGEQLFTSLQQQIKLGGINPEIASLISGNHEHYIRQ